MLADLDAARVELSGKRRSQEIGVRGQGADG
jgi:hypothetical protein